uniref:Cobalt transporter subunit CbtA n=1 Tax=Candidatus Kentrum sp. FW TaxID=2126338 RepID=A0A450TQW8_9GAMM|nr:MAG: cobalt transporter subunit CbtA [Candidatus Kentron sp. FW]
MPLSPTNIATILALPMNTPIGKKVGNLTKGWNETSIRHWPISSLPWALPYCWELLWGFAGYVVFFLAHALGMAPELPGSHSGALERRQLWWLLTVICTGLGFAFIVFNTQALVKILGVVLFVVPHAIGAPHAPAPKGVVPPELIRSFVIATVITNAVFRLALGSVYGFFDKRLAS